MADRPCIAFACAPPVRRTAVRRAARRRSTAASTAASSSSRAGLARRDGRCAARRRRLRASPSSAYRSAATVALEVARRQPTGSNGLALLDTRASTDSEAQRAGRHADIEKVRAGGIEALIPELPSRWLLPAHAARADLSTLMADMARSVGARGQRNQQLAMLVRPDSHADLERLRLPALVLCGEQDAATPVAGHEAMAARLAGSRLEIVPQCGHLSTIEQPER
jgi:pimeloyl-ACP methyl ester carboxylesterase